MACVLCLAVGCSGGRTEPQSVAHAESQGPAPSPLYELDQALRRIKPDSPTSDPSPPSPAEATRGTSTAKPAKPAATPTAVAPLPKPRTLDDVVADMSSLRGEFQELRKSVNETLDLLVADLHSENQRLRAELARRNGAAQVATVPGQGVVPMGRPEVTGDSILIRGEPAATDPVPATAPSGQASYTVVKEWGRTSAEAKSVGPNVASLKGMICEAPAGLSDDQLAELGRRIRAENADYDNLNIEVFDSAEAARQYAEKNIGSDLHHVLSVSRHRASGRDSVIVLRNAQPRQVPL
jgi:hypothetical protein